MSAARIRWSLGVVALALAIPVAVSIARILPLGYDFRAYWLAAHHLMQGTSMYPGLDAPLGQPDEFHYLPQVAIPFVVFLPLGIDAAARVWLVLELVLAAAVGYQLIRPLPHAARPWAAAAYVLFLPLVLEIVLGNVDLLSLALALLAWHWRERAYAPVIPYAAAIGMKFLPLVLLPFYLAAGYWRTVLRAFAFGLAVLLITSPLVWRPMFFALIPRFLDTTWVRLHVEREDPEWLARIVWSDALPLVLAVGSAGLAAVFGWKARHDRARETEWHHLALALSPYLVPFGFTWTTFLIMSLPLFAMTLGKALRLADARTRAVAVAGLAFCWLAMQAVQVHVLWPLVAHMAGVLGLVVIALLLMRLETAQTLGRSTPRARATSTASA